jgi:nucleotide-binding universal stress UspA family protein
MLSYRTIVVGTDFSPLSSVCIEAALEIAKIQGARRVHLVHVVQGSAPVLPPSGGELDAAGRAAKAAAERLEGLELPKTITRISKEVRFGSPARELALVADELHADLVVIASHSGSALARLVLGSAAQALIRVARCPVLVVNGPSDSPGRFQRVLASIDLSPVSYPVLANAFNVAYSSGAQVQVLSLYEPPVLAASPDELLPHYVGPEEIDLLDQQHRDEVARLLKRVPRGCVEVEVEVLRRGSAPQVILEFAKQREAELLVMGTSGRNAWHRMILGSTANHVLVKAPCPVLVVPHEARESVRHTKGLAAVRALPS